MESKVVLKKHWFIDSKKGNIKEQFYFQKKLGSGGYGTVYQARKKSTGEHVAIKAIQKTQVQDYQNFQNEINILKTLDHPNIVRLYQTWETERICFLITELCGGGELFYHITQKKFLKESDASVIMKQAFSAIKYCHDNNICHRDLKPENFLLQKAGDIKSIKLIDFGLSQKLSENQLMTTPNGTPFYIAPQVLKGTYSKECDNWSLGVILYILICGRPPFGGKGNVEILKKVVEGEVKFQYPPFKTASEDVKDLILNLLIKDPAKRFNAGDALNHKWIQQYINKDDDGTEGHDISQFLQEFIESQALRRTALTYIASRINESDVEVLKESFYKFDKNGDGRVSTEELINGLKQLNNDKLKEGDVLNVMKQLDTNKNGFIDYTEFIAGCLQTQSMLKEKHLLNAFSYFDTDKNGKITKDELKNCLSDEDLMMNNEEIEKMISEVDQDGDGAIDYQEFLKMMVKE